MTESELVVEAATTLPEGEPARTIGWDVIRWCEAFLLSPMADGSPLQLTVEQCKFLAWWYAVDADGRWLFRRGVLRRAKGWGKDPLAAVIALVEMLGPCRVAGWDSAGEPVGGADRAPLVAVAAVAKAQTINTTSMLDVVASPELVARHRLRLGLSGLSRGRTVAGAKAELHPITSSWRSSEGARVTAVIASETQHWRATNGGHEMAAVLARNLAKIPGGEARMLSITNAHEPGEDSVAERDHEAWLEQVRAQQTNPAAPAVDILLDSREAVVDDRFDVRDRTQMVPALRASYGDSVWVDVDRQAAEAADPEMSEAHVLRFLLNRITAGARRWMDPAALDAAESHDPIPDAGSAIAVGFDGSRTTDSTAIVCTDMVTGYQWLAGIWERDWTLEEWEIDDTEVDEAFEQIFSTWVVARAYGDPAWWEEDLARWCGRWDVFAAWEMRGQHAVRAARAVTAYRGAITRNPPECRWGGPNAAVLRQHCLNAVERPLAGTRNDDGRLHTIAKTSRRSRFCIDAAVAGVLSWTARLDAVAAGWQPPVKFKAHSRSLTEARLEKARKAAEAEAAGVEH